MANAPRSRGSWILSAMANYEFCILPFFVGLLSDGRLFPCPFGPLVILVPGEFGQRLRLRLGVSPLCRMNDPGIVAATIPPANPLRITPPRKTSAGGNCAHVTGRQFSYNRRSFSYSFPQKWRNIECIFPFFKGENEFGSFHKIFILIGPMHKRNCDTPTHLV